MKMNGAMDGRSVSSVPRHRRRRLVMSFEMVRLDRALSDPLYQQLYRQIREELELRGERTSSDCDRQDDLFHGDSLWFSSDLRFFQSLTRTSSATAGDSGICFHFILHNLSFSLSVRRLDVGRSAWLGYRFAVRWRCQEEPRCNGSDFLLGAPALGGGRAEPCDDLF
jgi:hypothetical protein